MDYEKTLAHFKIKTRHGDRIQAFCPGHDDKNASLSILIADNKMLLFCHAGCLIDDVMKSAGITYNDIFPEKPPPVGVYQYRTEDGHLAYEKVKYKTSDGKTFKQRRIEGDNIVPNLTDVKKIPYNYPNVLKSIKEDGLILYVEGEKDADTARLLGYTATTMGGASDWKDEYKLYFQKANIAQIPDKDEPGITLTKKITKSLTEVAKSLKVIVLPVGKDLTEWVEQGNSDLSTLISTSPDLITYKGLSEPIMSKTLSGYSFTWKDLNLIVKIDRLNDDAKGIIAVKDLNTDRTLHTSEINLLSTRSLAELAKRLTVSKKVQWDAILSLISNRCYDTLRDGGETVNIDQPAKNMKIEYLLEPIIPANEPVTIYTAGGKGKSIFADFIAIMVQYGIASPDGLCFIPSGSNNVLYLDWEADEETHRRYITAIKRGMEHSGLTLPNEKFIAYRRLEYPLAQVIDSIKSEIIHRQIGLVIIDSQMAATASGTRGLTEAQVASEYYNMLRSFHCATLTIDHITKVGMTLSGSNGAEAPYGSVVKYNRSRSQFELRLPEDDEDTDHKEYALVHRKYNLGRKLKPIGIALDYVNDGDTLVEVRYSRCEIKDNPSFSAVLQLKDQIRLKLNELRKATVKELAVELKQQEGSIRTTLNRNVDMFIKNGENWSNLE